MLGRDDAQIGDVPGDGRPLGALGVDDGAGVLDVELVDDERVPAVHVERAVVDGRVRRVGVDRAEQPAGLRLDDRHRLPAAAADVDVGPPAAGPVPAGRPAPQLAGGHELLELRLGRPAEVGEVLGCSGSSAAAQHSCGPSTYGLAGSVTVASIGRPKTARGWWTR